MSCVIPLIFAAALNRAPGPVAVDYWSEVIAATGGRNAAHWVLAQPETLGAGRTVEEWYWTILGRTPDAAGLVYWESKPADVALWGIATSVEAGCIDPPPPAAPAGWVDGGHGVWLPPELVEIRQCESGGNYQAANRRSSARGAYQFLKSSWAAYGHAARYGVSTADAATPAQQDEAALITWQRDGVRPWYASRSCWS